MMYLHEVFTSVQGEGYDSGFPTTFVRFYGCNLKCTYCDQPQSPSDYSRISIENVVKKVKSLGVRKVCITGGEPLIQKDIYPLIYELCGEGYDVSIETHGCLPLTNDNYARSFKYVMDIKCPSSGESHRCLFENLGILHSKDEVKFVIKDRVDYEFMKDVLNKYPTRAKLLVSPMFDNDWKPLIGSELVRWLIEDKLEHIKIQIQIHKVLGVR